MNSVLMPNLQLLSHNTPYLDRYPALETIQDPRINEIAFPGSDGNTLLLLYRLIQYRVVECSEDNYLAIKKLLQIDSKHLSSEQFYEIIQRFNRLSLARQSHFQNVIILGKLLSGPTGNDYFTLKLLNIIREKSLGRLNFRILLGLNEYDFLSALKAIQAIRVTEFNLGGCESALGAHAKFSTRQLAILLDQQLISTDEFHLIVKNLIEHYLHVAWSSMNDQNKLLVYSAGFLSQSKFGALQHYFSDLEINAGTNTELKETLHQLIASLNQKIKNPRSLYDLHQFFSAECRVRRNGNTLTTETGNFGEKYPLFYLASDRNGSLNENHDPHILSIHANMTHLGGHYQVSLRPGLQFIAYLTSNQQATYATAGSRTTQTLSFANHPLGFTRKPLSLKTTVKPTQRTPYSKLHILEGKISALPKALFYSIPNNTDYRLCIMGDAHGNAMKLLQFLLLHNIVECSEETYQAIFNFYLLKQEEVTAEQLAQIQTLIAQLKIAPAGHKIKIISLGDLLCDRGLKDWLTLAILERLQKEEKIEVSITISNHDAEFLLRYRKAKTIFEEEHKVLESVQLREKLASALETPITLSQSSAVCSLVSLANWIRRGVLNFSDLTTLLHRAYLPALKQFDFELVENQILLFGHAPVGLEYYRALAELAGQVFHSSTGLRLLRSLLALKKETLLFNFDLVSAYLTRLQNEPFRRELTPKDSPLNYAIWNRSAQFISFERAPSDLQLIVFHGHDDRSTFPMEFNRYFISMDDQYGKAPSLMFANETEKDFRSYQSVVVLPEPQSHASLASEQSSVSIPSVESSASLASESPTRSTPTRSESDSTSQAASSSNYTVIPPSREITSPSAMRRINYTQRQETQQAPPANKESSAPKPRR